MTDDNPFLGQEALTLEELIETTAVDEIDEADIDAAVDWWDENASDLFYGVLES